MGMQQMHAVEVSDTELKYKLITEEMEPLQQKLQLLLSERDEAKAETKKFTHEWQQKKQDMLNNQNEQLVVMRQQLAQAKLSQKATPGSELKAAEIAPSPSGST